MRNNTVQTIRQAAMDNVLVTINYIDSKGNFSERLIEPYEIKNGSLFGYCLDKESIRNFKLSKISLVTRTNTRFTPRWAINI